MQDRKIEEATSSSLVSTTQRLLKDMSTIFPESRLTYVKIPVINYQHYQEARPAYLFPMTVDEFKSNILSPMIDIPRCLFQQVALLSEDKCWINTVSLSYITSDNFAYYDSPGKISEINLDYSKDTAPTVPDEYAKIPIIEFLDDEQMVTLSPDGIVMKGEHPLRDVVIISYPSLSLASGNTHLTILQNILLNDTSLPLVLIHLILSYHIPVYQASYRIPYDSSYLNNFTRRIDFLFSDIQKARLRLSMYTMLEYLLEKIFEMAPHDISFSNRSNKQHCALFSLFWCKAISTSYRDMRMEYTRRGGEPIPRLAYDCFDNLAEHSLQGTPPLISMMHVLTDLENKIRFLMKIHTPEADELYEKINIMIFRCKGRVLDLIQNRTSIHPSTPLSSSRNNIFEEARIRCKNAMVLAGKAVEYANAVLGTPVL